jgi:hypothetical protein
MNRMFIHFLPSFEVDFLLLLLFFSILVSECFSLGPLSSDVALYIEMPGWSHTQSRI